MAPQGCQRRAVEHEEGGTVRLIYIVLRKTTLLRSGYAKILRIMELGIRFAPCKYVSMATKELGVCSSQLSGEQEISSRSRRNMRP